MHIRHGMKLELVSFPLCPYVQRSVITLNYKKAAFVRTDIDLENPPKWFLELSPLGRVPVLIVDGMTLERRAAIFESTVINEFLDEIIPPQLHPKNPLQRALERAWIESSSELLRHQYNYVMQAEPETRRNTADELFEILAHVEKAAAAEPFFRGSQFSLVDAAFAPLFMRLELISELRDDMRWEALPKLRRWSDELLAMNEVQKSVHPNFRAAFRSYLKRYSQTAA